MLGKKAYKEGTKPYLLGLQMLVNAAFPETNPRVVEQKDKEHPLGLQLSMSDLEPEILMVSPNGWSWRGTGTDGEAVSLARDYGIGTDGVLVLFIGKYLHYWMGTIFPDLSELDMQIVADHLGQGSRDYELLNNLLRFLLMVRDGQLEEEGDDDTELRKLAQMILTWLSGSK